MTFRLREAIRVTCLLLIMLTTPTALVAWFAFDRATQLIWILRVCASALFVVSFGVFVCVHFAQNKVPDYLTRYFGSFFDCEGFCFCVRCKAEDGICYVDVYFQNRHDREFAGRVTLHPRSPSLRKRQLSVISCEVECSGGSFGVVRTPVPVSLDVQGESHSFDVTARVEYPTGRGKTLFYRDSTFIRSGVKMQIAGAITSPLNTLMTASESTVRLEFPSGVASQLPEDLAPTTKILWHMNDKELPEHFDGVY